MKFTPIEYFIDVSNIDLNKPPKRVAGYAIDFPGCRICIRRIARGWWVADHFDTGLRIPLWSLPDSTRQQVAYSAIEYMKMKIDDGSYERALEAWRGLKVKP